MTNEFALWIAITSGAFAVSGALGSQVINALVSLKAKRLELVYTRKADTYKAFMEKAGDFAGNYSDLEKYRQFIHSYYATTVVASTEVEEALSKEGALILVAEKLHAATSSSDANRIIHSLEAGVTACHQSNAERSAKIWQVGTIKQFLCSPLCPMMPR